MIIPQMKFCKERGIYLNGPRLGRPPKETDQKRRRLERRLERIRNSIEGKFGEGKRCYQLGRIMAKRQETSESVIMLQFLVMNLEKRLRVLWSHFFKVLFFGCKPIALEIQSVC
jgi:IS5 family transposase